jgi:hypothetical protein
MAQGFQFALKIILVLVASNSRFLPGYLVSQHGICMGIWFVLCRLQRPILGFQIGGK